MTKHNLIKESRAEKNVAIINKKLIMAAIGFC